MANHGFVTTRKTLTPEMVDRDIREIVERRFKNKLEIKYDKVSENSPKKGTYDIWAGWEFHLPIPSKNDKRDWYYDFTAWIMSPHKLEFRHPHADWAFWAQSCVLQEELAYRYNGIISDEGVSERWKSSPERLKKYATYRKWLEARFGGNRFAPRLMKGEWLFVHPVLRALDRKIAGVDPKILIAALR